MDSQDLLGLDQPIKLGRVSRIPKLTDELLFSNIRGIPQIRNNYKKLSALLRKIDHEYADRIKKSASKSGARQLKVACQTEKLKKVLLFYQLWCHGLFPRANFKDCIQMLRRYSSFPLKEYRRGLINNELHKLKIEKGIISDEPPPMSDPEDEDDLYTAPNADNQQEGTLESTANANIDDDEDDWGFLSIRKGNQLFVADDDENTDGEPDKDTLNEANGHAQTKNRKTIDDIDDDELLDLLPTEFLTQTQTQMNDPVETNPEDFVENISEHDEELDIMREMGM